MWNENEHTDAENKKRRKKRIWLIVLIVIAAMLLAAIIGCVVYFESLLSLINHADEEILETMSPEQYQLLLDQMQETVPEDYTGAIMSADDVDWGDEQELLEGDDDIINILLIGQDTRTREQRSRTDTLILVTINKPAKTITLTSFMRDLYVMIPGYKDNRINVAYILGGTNLLETTLRRNFGVYVDGNVIVDFYGFMDIVNMMGGIDIELSAAEANYMNENFSWDVDDGEDDDWNLTEGVNHLTGSQALSYARMRKIGNSDWERTERQRTVVSKLIEKAKSLSVSELNLLLQHALPMITTDIEDAQLLSYALELFPMLPELEVNTLRIPKDGTFENTVIDGMWVMLPDLYWNRVALEKVMKIPEE